MSEMQQVRRWVSIATLTLLGMLTVASTLNIRDMAEQTHTATGAASWIVSVAIGGTLSVLAYVASITDGRTRTMATTFAVFAALVSTALQVSLFLGRGAPVAVAVAFGIGVPFFEVALALTDSMLRRYVMPVQAPSKKAKSVTPVPVQDVTPVTPAPVQVDDAPTVNKSELARQYNVSRQTIDRWIKQGKLQPDMHLNGATGD